MVLFLKVLNNNGLEFFGSFQRRKYYWKMFLMQFSLFDFIQKWEF